MLSYAPRVCREPEQLALLRANLASLQVQAHVILTLSEGAQVAGVVAVQPQLETFQDCQQRQGMNAIVRLDDPDRPMQQHVVWADSIEAVQLVAIQPG